MWFFNKDHEERIEKLEKEVKQANCNHPLNSIYFRKILRFMEPDEYRFQVCSNCGKELKHYDNEINFNEDKIEYFRLRINELEKEIQLEKYKDSTKVKEN